MNSECDVGARLRANGWRQGSIVSPSDCPRLALNLPAGAVFGVVVSQDCDVVASDSLESQVEIVAASHTTKPDTGTLNGKNPRLLSIPVSRLGGHLELDLRHRTFVSKAQLCDSLPFADGHLLTSDVRLMARWLGKRYARDAFPDAFNTRLSSVKKKLGKIAKSPEGKCVEVILVSLEHGNAELTENEPYKIVIWFVFRQRSPVDDAPRAQAEKFARAFVSTVESCEGIEVSDDSVKSLSEVTLEDLEAMKRFDYDFRSPELDTDSTAGDVWGSSHDQ